jgi:hypothetical protein
MATNPPPDGGAYSIFRFANLGTGSLSRVILLHF